jgi:hypothetical protein
MQWALVLMVGAMNCARVPCKRHNMLNYKALDITPGLFYFKGE